MITIFWTLGVFTLLTATLTTSSPVVYDYEDTTTTTDGTTTTTTDGTTVPDDPSTTVEPSSDKNDVVVLTRVVDDILPSVDGDLGRPVIERNIQEFVVPVGGVVEIVIPEVDIMETADSIVFAPIYRFERFKNQRRRVVKLHRT